MGVVIACAVLLVVGLVVAVKFGGSDLAPPPMAKGDPGRRERLRRYLWWVELVLVVGVLSGITVVGAGGRLAMRLLGATAGDSAQGRLTEADEVVGEITVGGTIGFFVFIGLGFGVITALAWFVLRRYLPPGRAGAVAFGAATLVVLGTRSEPLRPDNTDFDLLGPWWLAILVFTALALLQGAAIAGFAGLVSRWLPLVGRSARSAVYVLLLVLVLAFPLGVAAAVGAAVVAFAQPQLERLWRALTEGRALLVGRLVLALVVLVALPGFVAGIADIVGRGPV